MKFTDKYLLSPGKTNIAGLKPVFSNSSNMLRKGENNTVTTEHHLEFPYFIKTLPKSGLKNNLKEYKNILKTFLKTDRVLCKKARETLGHQVNSKLSPLNLANTKNYFDQESVIKTQKLNTKKKSLQKSINLKSNNLKFKNTKNLSPIYASSQPQSPKNSSQTLEKVITKYIKSSLKNNSLYKLS
jgi:hypothetical protein